MKDCKCVNCQNFDGSDLRNRILAGEDLETIKAKKLKLETDGDEEGRFIPARSSRKKTTYEEEDDEEDDESKGSVLTSNNNNRDQPVPPVMRSSIQLNPSFPVKPPPVPFPSSSSRTFRNQLVRLDLCSFVGSAMESYSNLILVGTEQNHNSHVPATQPQHNGDDHVLKTNETMPESSLLAMQERFVLEETTHMLKKCLQSTMNAVESSKIIKF